MHTLIYTVSEYMKKHPKNFAGEPDEEMQVPEDIEMLTGLPYASSDGSPLTMNIYRQKDTEGEKRPVILMVHGGGLFVDARAGENRLCCRLARQGYLVFSLDYRLLDQDADGCQEIDDVLRGMEYAAEHMDSYGGDPDRVSVLAESAGAYLLLYACAALRSPAVRQAISCRLPEKPITFQKAAFFSGMLYTTAKDPVGLLYAPQLYGKKRFSMQFLKLMAPEHPEVMNSLPPVLMVTSDADFLKSHTRRYFRHLQEANHPARLLYYRNNKLLTHAFPAFRMELKETADVMEKLDSWFRGK